MVGAERKIKETKTPADINENLQLIILRIVINTHLNALNVYMC